MIITLLLIYALIGIVAGVLGGLLGISGGLITVPALLFFFAFQHFPSDSLMHLAIGTSLASMVITALASTVGHHARGAVLWRLISAMFPGLAIGAVLGPFIVRNLTSALLESIFGIFALILGVYFLIKQPKSASDSPRLPPGPVLSLIALIIGGLSTVLGLGGGIMTMPTLLAFRVTLKKAIGTAAAAGLVVTTIGAISFLYFGMNKEITQLSFGYIYLPAFVMISVSTYIAAPFGVRLAHYLPSLIIRRLFGLILLATGAMMLLSRVNGLA